jgi:NDP-sugar pyrophosphorylase family protein
VKAVLLGAGLGTRLAPLTDTTPKILLPIAGEALLSRQLRYLASQGVTDVALNVHHRSDQIEGFLREAVLPVAVHLFHEASPLGTAGALLPMADLLTEPFVLLYGDVVTDLRLEGLRSSLNGIAALAYYPCEDVRGKGVVEVAANGRIVRFTEKADSNSRPGLVNAGIYALDPAILSWVRPGDDFGFDIWPRVLAAGTGVFGYRIDAYLADIGSHETLQRVDDDARNGRFAW